MFIQGIVYYVFGMIGFTNGIKDSFKYMNKTNNDIDNDVDNEYLIKYRDNLTINQKLFIYIISGTIYSLTYLSIPILSNRIFDYLIK
jgi:hypothetical protein